MMTIKKCYQQSDVNKIVQQISWLFHENNSFILVKVIMHV